MLHAYIDESGQRGHSDSASPHFVMSAILFRTANQQRAKDLLATLRTATGRQPHHELTFKRLSPEHRTTVSTAIGAQSWVRTITVVVCKDHLPDTIDGDSAKYLYAFRLLLERISWLAAGKQEVCTYTLAHIQRFRIENLREYEKILRAMKTRIYWKYLDPKGGRLNQPRVLEELQLADLVASSAGIAFNPPANTAVVETSYLEALRPTMYESGAGEVLANGLKMHPWNEATKAAYPWVAAL